MLETILAALKAIPLIVEKLDDLSNAIKSAQDARTDMELALIKDQLNSLTAKLRTTEDKRELQRIIEGLNRI